MKMQVPKTREKGFGALLADPLLAPDLTKLRAAESAHTVSGRRPAWLLGVLCGLLLAALALSPSANAASFPLRLIGGPHVIDVPAPADRLIDINPFRTGKQVLAQALEDTREHKIRLISVLDLKTLAEGDTDDFNPRGLLWAGWRVFVGGQDESGRARLWTPALDSTYSWLSFDPPLSCGSATDAATPIAGPFPVTIPPGARPGGHSVSSPTSAFVFGDPINVAKGVRVTSTDGVVLGKTTSGVNVAQGGFGFADAVFAYGTAGGMPTLWSPELLLKSQRLRSIPFLACADVTPPPPAAGTITVSKYLVPATDPGRFDLRIDSEIVAAATAVGDGGSTGPVLVPIGTHSVSESAAMSANLDDYTVQTWCTENSNPASPVTAPAGVADIPVAAGDEWQCTITNTRIIDPGNLTVQSHPDAARAASKTIGTLGGTIEAIAANGTRYSLFVPPGALLAPTEITLTPTAVDGLDPIATAVPFAVEFAPSGLILELPARLTITPLGDPVAVDFAASWQDSIPGVAIEPLRVNTDGTLVTEVQHFSGVASIRATIHAYNTLLTLALSRLPDYNGWKAQLIAHAAALPGTEADVVNDVQQIYAAHVLPFLNSADTGIVELRVASQRLQELEYLYQFLPIGGIAIPGSPSPATLLDLLNDAGALFAAKGTAFLAAYTTNCDGPVNELADWVAIPLLARAELMVRGMSVPPDYCARAALDTLSWSSRINPSDTSIQGALRGAIEAPGHTPGGIAQGGRKLFPQPTEFALHARDATFPGGSSDLSQITPDDDISRLDFQLDRASGPQSVVVEGIASVYGFAAEIIAADSSFETVLPIHLTASTGTISVTFLSPPTNSILPFGQTTNLCVDVLDGDASAIAGATVAWTLTGPGSLAAATSTTNGFGTACVDYHHPAGPVTQGDTATIEASTTHDGDTGNTSVALTPDWARITIETRRASQSSFQTTTNTSLYVPVGELVQLIITVTGPGNTPHDPPQPLPATSIVQVEIDSGGGLLSEDANPGTQQTSFLSLVDQNGQAHLTWDPTGSTQDTTIRVNYPDTILFPGGGVTATVTFTHTPPPPPPPPPSGLDFTGTFVSWGGYYDGFYTQPVQVQITQSADTITGTFVSNLGELFEEQSGSFNGVLSGNEVTGATISICGGSPVPITSSQFVQRVDGYLNIQFTYQGPDCYAQNRAVRITVCGPNGELFLDPTATYLGQMINIAPSNGWTGGVSGSISSSGSNISGTFQGAQGTLTFTGALQPVSSHVRIDSVSVNGCPVVAQGVGGLQGWIFGSTLRITADRPYICGFGSSTTTQLLSVSGSGGTYSTCGPAP